MTTSQSRFPCKVCEQGILVSKTIFRMSGPVVAIGYILLIPSILGIVLSVMLFVRAISSERNRIVSEASEEMRNVGVPEPIISTVIAGRDQEANKMMDEWPNEPIEYEGHKIESESKGLDEVGRSWVQDAQEKLRKSKATLGLGLAVLVKGGFAIGVGIASFVSGLLGWLLVMKKRVLQCSVCKATVSAS